MYKENKSQSLRLKRSFKLISSDLSNDGGDKLENVLPPLLEDIVLAISRTHSTITRVMRIN